MPTYYVSERQIVLVTATIEAETEEEAMEIFLDGDPPGIETKVIENDGVNIEKVEEA